MANEKNGVRMRPRQKLRERRLIGLAYYYRKNVAYGKD